MDIRALLTTLAQPGKAHATPLVAEGSCPPQPSPSSRGLLEALYVWELSLQHRLDARSKRPSLAVQQQRQRQQQGPSLHDHRDPSARVNLDVLHGKVHG